MVIIMVVICVFFMAFMPVFLLKNPDRGGIPKGIAVPAPGNINNRGQTTVFSII